MDVALFLFGSFCLVQQCELSVWFDPAKQECNEKSERSLQLHAYGMLILILDVSDLQSVSNLWMLLSVRTGQRHTSH
jgi:hypothetical protein